MKFLKNYSLCMHFERLYSANSKPPFTLIPRNKIDKFSLFDCTKIDFFLCLDKNHFNHISKQTNI